MYDHSVAVAQAAYAIARRMRLSGDETASVIRAALLHESSSVTTGTVSVLAVTCAGIPACGV